MRQGLGAPAGCAVALTAQMQPRAAVLLFGCLRGGARTTPAPLLQRCSELALARTGVWPCRPDVGSRPGALQCANPDLVCFLNAYKDVAVVDRFVAHPLARGPGWPDGFLQRTLALVPAPSDWKPTS